MVIKLLIELLVPVLSKPGCGDNHWHSDTWLEILTIITSDLLFHLDLESDSKVGMIFYSVLYLKASNNLDLWITSQISRQGVQTRSW